MNHIVAPLAAITIVATLAAASPADTFTSYHIGNSLTWDSRPDRLPAYAALVGKTHDPGYHINCNQSLLRIVSNPDDVCVNPADPYGLWNSACSSFAWNAVTFQPFWGGLEPPKLSDDIQSIQAIIGVTLSNPENGGTVFYQYSTWGNRNVFMQTWDDPTPFGLDDQSQPRRQYHDQLFDLVDDLTDAEMRLIPAGEVLFLLGERAAAGQIPGIDSVDDFYRDNIHMSEELGRFLATTTVLTVLRNVDPRTLPDNPAFGSIDSPFPDTLEAETAKAITTAIWDIVTADERTGVVDPCPGDINGSGNVDVADISAVLTNFGAQHAWHSQGDASRNGSVDAIDISIVLSSFGDVCDPS